jgi:hypothetical protein
MPAVSIFTLAYQSRNLIEAITLDSSAELARLLAVSRARNEKLGVTGALLFNENRFYQILEGDEDDVRAIYASIERDVRHTDVVLLLTETIARRHFEKWSMAFLGMQPGARDYYKTFTLDDDFEWTKASAARIADMMVGFIADESAVAQERQEQS